MSWPWIQQATFFSATKKTLKANERFFLKVWLLPKSAQNCGFSWCPFHGFYLAFTWHCRALENVGPWGTWKPPDIQVPLWGPIKGFTIGSSTSLSNKNWMGPYQRTPSKLPELLDAIRYSGSGVRSVGLVGDFFDSQELPNVCVA